LKYTLNYGCSSLDADCIGAVLIDVLLLEVNFVKVTPTLISGNSWITVIF